MLERLDSETPTERCDVEVSVGPLVVSTHFATAVGWLKLTLVGGDAHRSAPSGGWIERPVLDVIPPRGLHLSSCVR